MKNTNWGILGTGKIAKKFAEDLQSLPNATLYAVGSRKKKTAKAFAKQFKMKKAYSSYKALLKDPKLDAVYIATPHTSHCENTCLALKHKVAVLCEKPLAINSQEVAKMVKKAKASNTFLMEALWTLFLPHLQKTEQLIKSGVIGKIQSIKADFGFQADYHPKSRLFDPALGGGALLDIGIYPLLLAQHFLGMPKKITAAGILGKTKVDEDIGMILEYEQNRIAHLHASVRSHTPTEAYIYGKKGYIHIPGQWHKPVRQIVVLQYKDMQKTIYQFSESGFGYKYEAAAMMTSLQKGEKESKVVSLQFSMDLMKTMDAIRKQLGVRYPVEG